jgi:hypothetical protein
MSGPKVVRVVTREEMVARCEAQLARLDITLARWSEGDADSSEATAARQKEAKRRRAELVAILQQDRFAEFQNRVQSEIAFLERDVAERREKAAAAAARKRLEHRRERQAAASLLGALQAAGRDIPLSVVDALHRAADGRADAAAALAAGFALLSGNAPEDAGSQRELAQSLKANEGDRSLSAWLARTGLDENDDYSRFGQPLAELSTFGDTAGVEAFERRIGALGVAEDGRRKLLVDSLTVDIARAVAAARRRVALTQSIEAAQAALEALTGSDSVLKQGLAELSTKELEAVLAAVERGVLEAQNAKAADSRRGLILRELAALGYEVGADLSTAWVRQGRVVLRRPSHPGYGVEVAGNPTSDKMQMRVVAFADAGMDVERDRDAESQWCGDVDQLKKRMKENGAELIVEKAVPVGAIPLKRVAAGDAADQMAREGPASRSWTLN